MNTFRFLDRIEDTLDGASRRLRRTLGRTRPPRILPMRGFGVPQGVRILARVLEDRGEGGNRWQKAYRRWATRELPGVPVEIHWRDRRWQARTDEEGYLDVTLPAPDRVEGGWHDVQLRLADARYPDTTATLRALVVGAEHDFGVLSDIDDTVIDTGVASSMNLLKSYFYDTASDKEPFPGIDELYRGLHAGRDGSGSNPMFYVSSSPMNLYEHLDRTFDRHRLPEGPLLLRDWGLDHQGFSPNGAHDHKLEKAERILERTGDLPFVLIGDSGQHDPELYLELVKRNPRRIAAVAVRDVTPDRRDAEVREIGESIEAQGVPFLAAGDTAEMARFFAERGFVAPATVDEVKSEAERAA
ncbi:MAG: hypothetical protein CMN30_13615 [Sandaracinus sp.]|nr:hypothetical protein [Sandaracinus sp.]|tara:strand:- start:495 stop:1565 length:1071 start_codon:yes stop_codon:yes gene_type:complete